MAMIYCRHGGTSATAHDPERGRCSLYLAMKKRDEADTTVSTAMAVILRAWLMGGILPLAACALLTFAVSAVWASPLEADEHNIERGFQAVMAVCAALFLTGFWLDGKWTQSDRIAASIWQAAGGDESVPTRSSQLAVHADVAFRSIRSSASALIGIGGAIAAAAVISAWAGLNLGQGAQLVVLGVCYQLFVFSRFPYYQEVLTAAAHGELVPAGLDDDSDNTR